MDELTDTVHEYIQTMAGSIQVLGHIEIAIESHSEVAAIRQNTARNAGIISYIQDDGKAGQAMLAEYLNKVRPIATRMLSLTAKGQVMGLENYNQCHDACTKLAWHLKYLESVAFTIGHSSLISENEKVQQTLDKMTSVKSQSILEDIEKQNGEFLKFIKQNYQSLFK